MSQRDTIDIQVSTRYLEHQSDPENSRYVFGYTVTMRNDGVMAAQLLTRHWVITDANGKVQEVRGTGVVGQQPYLAPGADYEYSSGAILETSVGAMHGSYGMRNDSGELFDAPITAFTLAVPGSLH
ncbi:MAG: Co2+/Mg2+ efflux protein ApaG [Pseudomonadota bacterium]